MDSELLIVVIQALAAVATAVVPVVLGQGFRWLRLRYNLELSRAQEQELHDAVIEGINYAEQWARNKAKQGVSPAGQVKLERAMVHAAKRLPGADTQRVRDVIEAELGRRNSVLPPAPANGRSGR